MKLRFGWSQASDMPRLYALRAMSDAASLTVDDFVESLLMDAATICYRSRGWSTVSGMRSRSCSSGILTSFRRWGRDSSFIV